MKRKVIRIDEELCNGCGNCIAGCHEGALQLIDGKAVMISDLYCDGLGACIGECPVGAITLEEREALPYDEDAVMERLAPKGWKVILAHLKHLKDNGQKHWVHQGVDYLKRNNIEADLSELFEEGQTCSGNSGLDHEPIVPCGCPGSAPRTIQANDGARISITGVSSLKHNAIASEPVSELRHFPVQLHLVNPASSFFQGADLLLASDCSAFSCGDFHGRFLRGKALAIACPKLDSNKDAYLEKLTAMIDFAKINTLTVVIMEVPCCSGLAGIAEAARAKAQRNIPLKIIKLSVKGEVLHDAWI